VTGWTDVNLWRAGTEEARPAARLLHEAWNRLAGARLVRAHGQRPVAAVLVSRRWGHVSWGDRAGLLSAWVFIGLPNTMTKGFGS
jgi:hypothetical protein